MYIFTEAYRFFCCGTLTLGPKCRYGAEVLISKLPFNWAYRKCSDGGKTKNTNEGLIVPIPRRQAPLLNVQKQNVKLVL